MKQSKIKKLKCSRHEDDRDISEYVFWYTKTTMEYYVDIYECIICREILQKSIDRQNKIREHNERQNEHSYNKNLIKRKKYLDKREESRKKDIWDDEVKNELWKGTKLKGHNKSKYKDSIPKEVLQLTRATMKLKRLIKSLKDKNNEIINLEKQKIEQEEFEKNKDYVFCKKHGTLKIENVIKSGISKWTGMQQYKCKFCMKNLRDDYYLRRKDYVLKKCKEYKNNNKDKVKITRDKYRDKLNAKNNKYETTERQGSTSN